MTWTRFEASMRPPEFTGGNVEKLRRSSTVAADLFNCFNEAAGIHRRKPRYRHRLDTGWRGLSLQ